MADTYGDDEYSAGDEFSYSSEDLSGGGVDVGCYDDYGSDFMTGGEGSDPVDSCPTFESW